VKKIIQRSNYIFLQWQLNIRKYRKYSIDTLIPIYFVILYIKINRFTIDLENPRLYVPSRFFVFFGTFRTRYLITQHNNMVEHYIFISDG